MWWEYTLTVPEKYKNISITQGYYIQQKKSAARSLAPARDQSFIPDPCSPSTVIQHTAKHGSAAQTTCVQLYGRPYACQVMRLSAFFMQQACLATWAWMYAAHCHGNRCTSAVWPKHMCVNGEGGGHVLGTGVVCTYPGATGYNAQMPLCKPIAARCLSPKKICQFCPSFNK